MTEQETVLFNQRAAAVFARMMSDIRTNCTAKGWRNGTNTVGDYVALLHSECSEILEAYRDTHSFAAEYGSQLSNGQLVVKPTGVPSECADVLIRLLDMCDVWGINLYEAYVMKMAYNRTRPYQHGGRTLAPPVDPS